MEQQGRQFAEARKKPADQDPWRLSRAFGSALVRVAMKAGNVEGCRWRQGGVTIFVARVWWGGGEAMNVAEVENRRKEFNGARSAESLPEKGANHGRVEQCLKSKRRARVDTPLV
jgi:hypothetical protein